MKIWSKLNYVFMWSAMVCGVTGMVMAIYQGANWSWQMSTAVWAFIAYLNQKTLDRRETESKEFIDRVKSDMNELIEKTKTK